MSVHGEFFWGHMDGRVGEVLRADYEHHLDFRAVVIRGIDSTRASDSIRAILDRYSLSSEVHCGSVVLSPGSFRSAVEAGLFTGFDEMWFLNVARLQHQIPTQLAATSDCVSFADGVPAAIRGCMDAASCHTLLADGCGLNFVTELRGFASWIRDFCSGG